MQPRGSDDQFVLTCDFGRSSVTPLFMPRAHASILLKASSCLWTFVFFAANYFSCSRTCRVLISFGCKHLVSAMRQRKDISSIAWISANGNALLIYRRKFVAPVSLRYSVVKTGHISPTAMFINKVVVCFARQRSKKRHEERIDS